MARQDLDEERSFEPGIGMVDSWVSSGSASTSYYHGNVIGTTRLMSDSGGDGVNPAAYTAFGERISGSMGGPEDRYGYAGAWGYQAHDFPSGDPIPFLHLGHRYYDPSSGRFLQRDPVGIDGGLNVYEHCGSDPVQFVDPHGLREWAMEVWGILPMPFHRWFGGGGHIPGLDPGKAQDAIVTTCTIVSFAAPIGATYKTITATAKTVRALKGSRIGRTMQRIRNFLRKDPAHHGKPPHWDGAIPEWWRKARASHK